MRQPDEREVPQYTVRELHPKKTRYCVAVFVIDEGERLARQLARMRPFVEVADILIADGGSSDGSVEPQRLAGTAVRAVIVKRGPGRLGAQMRMAFEYALDQGYEGLVTMDGNDKDDPAAIPRFVAELEKGADHIQGSRFVPGGIARRTPLDRLLAVRLLHAPMLSRAAGFRYTDTTNGFRAYSRRLLEDQRVAPFRSIFSGYELHYYLAIRAARLGFRVCEIPVTREYPAAGKTPTKIGTIRGRLEVFRALRDACRGRFDPEAP